MIHSLLLILASYFRAICIMSLPCTFGRIQEIFFMLRPEIYNIQLKTQLYISKLSSHKMLWQNSDRVMKLLSQSK